MRALPPVGGRSNRPPAPPLLVKPQAYALPRKPPAAHEVPRAQNGGHPVVGVSESYGQQQQQQQPLGFAPADNTSSMAFGKPLHVKAWGDTFHHTGHPSQRPLEGEGQRQLEGGGGLMQANWFGNAQLQGTVQQANPAFNPGVYHANTGSM